MATKLKLIKEAHNQNVELTEQVNSIITNLAFLAEKYDTTPDVLMENVLQVLANFSNDVQQNKPIHALANIGSLSAFLAGVEAVSTSMAQLDPQKKARSLQALRDVSIGNDGMVSVSVQPIVDTGVGKPELQQKYTGLIQSYINSLKTGKPNNQQLMNALGKLRMSVDAAARASAPGGVGNPPTNSPPRSRLSPNQPPQVQRSAPRRPEVIPGRAPQPQ